jgi:hypothetical protein
VAGVAGVARERREKRGQRELNGLPRMGENLSPGQAVTGAALARPRSSASAPRGRPAARSAPPDRPAPADHHNARELASARTNIGHEHQDDAASRPRPGRR